ncbi:multidrug effflux MFS transporter [Dictyobacter arantiisoli]|uniref:Bcr/CflA family drug resistance efflux transporter n=1 Tax=Dictyobacter arantiisoli TaxID=2014874 RepID=A0A5A5TDL9_9CHLR|nr:multidrug effflux MFS transporter [Dictyobacter arantiisoli]GCF09139.1 Bcr/CflA family drug resistance efflux transporter [Dictyobacter arantiisoli]
MSNQKLLSTQQSNQETTLLPIAAETDQRVTESNETATRVRLKHVLLLGGLTAFAPLSTDMYLPSLPAVSHDLSATMALTQITLTACILGLAFGQVVAGPISDARGRRWPLLIGIAVYMLASLLCMLAPSVAILSLLRFVQGFAGAAGIVIALAIARDLYAGSALARCISLLMTVNFLAPIVAPVLGGQLLTFTSWRGVFVMLALLGLVALLASAFGLSETLETSHRQSGGVSATLRSFRGLLVNKRFVGYALSSSFAFAAAMIYISMSPFVLENIYGLSPQIFGLLFGINALGLASMSQVSGRLVSRVSPQRLLIGGVVALAMAGLALLVVVITGIGLVGVLPLLFFLVASLGFIAPNATALALGTTDPQTAGSASGLLGMLQFAIGAVIAPLVGLAGTSTAVPMAGAIAAFGVVALLTFFVFCRPAPVR